MSDKPSDDGPSGETVLDDLGEAMCEDSGEAMFDDSGEGSTTY